LDHRVVIETHDEIGDLARQFNRMADQLRASHVALERRVAEKTRDLSALYALTTPIGRASQLQQVMDDAVLKVMDVTETEAASLHLLEGDGSHCTLASAHGFSDATRLEMLEETWSGTLHALLRASQEPLFVVDLEHNPGSPQRVLAAAGFRSAAF